MGTCDMYLDYGRNACGSCVEMANCVRHNFRHASSRHGGWRAYPLDLWLNDHVIERNCKKIQ